MTHSRKLRGEDLGVELGELGVESVFSCFHCGNGISQLRISDVFAHEIYVLDLVRVDRAHRLAIVLDYQTLQSTFENLNLLILGFD
jgi:hypothetical protein